MARPVVAAVDIGGTRVKSALVDERGAELVSQTTRTPSGLSERGALVATVADAVAALRSQAPGDTQLAAVGVVVPGLVDDAAGVARYASNLGWRDVQVVVPLEHSLHLPVALGHDVRAGLLAESRWGAARTAQHVLFMPLGTGIAGALLLDGHVVSADGWSGELGHVVVEPGGAQCPCGQRGCLEMVASASAVEHAYAARSGEGVGADVVAARVAAGEPAAQEVWARAVDALARALVMTVTLTGVDLVLVGGGLSRSGELLLAPLREAVDTAMTFQRRPRIITAALGDRAGCLGSACLAWDLA